MPEHLWNFALRVYARPALAPRLLDWQERFGADVNLLLTALWLAGQGRIWDANIVQAVTAHCRDWRAGAIVPLRASRRALVGTDIYPALKKAELAAEQVQIGMLQRWLEAVPLAADGDALARNLRVYAATLAAMPSDSELQALQTVAATTS